ncbi:hypothetical protein ABOM_002933 [Aspergillus bombycis]|uniref:Nucleoside phosphorylase domain-containing protein n=1 Tax=Aspergillus bombycis TaxID=109264 RepID=A0A1F8A8R5_9EURO|nr:hypothetical protein ABOM_002933 [Aspergillus bombycis]OGM48114.1 hypothetical protein ABOM_002933 [Aspergillus bombycis]
MAAAKLMLDNIHPKLSQARYDHNTYVFGDIDGHNVVIACLPFGDYGTTSAAVVADQMLCTFRSVRFGLMVGIGGGVPNVSADVRLGDIVVSKPTNTFNGVVQYDFGKTIAAGRFERTGALSKPPHVLLTAISHLQSNHIIGINGISNIITKVFTQYPVAAATFGYPGQQHDQLFVSTYEHEVSTADCSRCDRSQLVSRPVRNSKDPQVHYGLIASANQVMKHGGTRDRLAEELQILCFEMEAAGLMDHFPCLVIRGICDYSDSHKNKQWQGYAAMVAAAYAKELLSETSGNHTTQQCNPVNDKTDIPKSTPAVSTFSPSIDNTIQQACSALLCDSTKHAVVELARHPETEMPKKPLGEDVVVTLSIIHGRGRSLYEQEKYDSAELAFREAVEGREEALGKDDVDTLNSIHWLGRSLSKQRKYQAAESLLQQVVGGRERALGEKHTDTLTSIQLLGCSLYGQKKYYAARQTFQRVADAREKVYGKEHLDTLESIYWLGRTLYKSQKYKVAEPLFQEVVEGRERTLGRLCKDTLESAQWLGRSLYKQEKYKAARTTFRLVAEGRKEILGKEHEDTQNAIRWLQGSQRLLFYSSNNS